MTMIGNENSPIERSRGERVLCAILPPTANIRMDNTEKDVDLIVNGQGIEVKWIGEGHLGDVRSALQDFHDPNVVFVARQMSPGARVALSESGVNWADETGAAEISIGMVLVSRTGSPNKKVYDLKRWTPAVISVSEALLCGKKGTQASMQYATGLSAGSCTNALRFLTNLELLTSTTKRGPDSARHVSNHRRLLDAYTVAANEQCSQTSIQIGVTWQDIIEGVAELGQGLESIRMDWAITGSAAAAIIAPFISSVSQATIYVEAKSQAELQALAERLRLRPVEGGRLTLKAFPNGTVRKLATVESHNLRVSPWPRVYADLINEGVRGEEAAEHLYEVVHGR